MKDVYGKVPDWRRLVPPERDVVTGRLTGVRDDKRREEEDQSQQDDASQDPSSHGASQGRSTATSPSGGSLVTAVSALPLPVLLAAAAAVIVALGVGGVIGARALTGSSRSPTPTVVAGPSGTAPVGGAGSTPGSGGASLPGAASPGPAGVASGPAGVASGPAGVASGPGATGAGAATAISLSYSGGALTQNECTDASGGGECSRLNTPFVPLTVRCTPEGCTVYNFDGAGVALRGPVTLSGTTSTAEDGCQETTWTLNLVPSGEATTEGIRHPARLTGQGRTSRPAEVLATINCLGAAETFSYDATPS